MVNYTKLAGQTLGIYQLKELLSDSAQVVATYRAHQDSLKRDVAIQILNPELYASKDYREAFTHSAKIIAELEHANIAPIHDFAIEDDLAYIVTRLMHGSLAKRVKADFPGVNEIIGIARQIGNALDYVHSKGYVHSDPSYSNIVFDQSGNAYIADFHVAGFQTVNPFIFTPLFAAPEKLRNGVGTALSDQFALASICFALLLQGVPVPDDFIQRKYYPDDYPLPELHQINSDIPKDVQPVFERALAYEPEDRYPTVVDFVREFEAAMQAKPGHLFISYSRRDTEFAQDLKEHLKNNGFEIWIDDAIEHGDQWFNEINTAINACSAFLVIMTPDAEQSEWVHKEILLAKRYQKPIFPLLLSGQEFPLLIDIQFADVKNGEMPGTDFHRRVRRVVFGQI